MSEVETTMEVRIINANTGEVISSKVGDGDTASAEFSAAEFIAHGIDNIEVECLIKEVKVSKPQVSPSCMRISDSLKWATGSVEYTE